MSEGRSLTPPAFNLTAGSCEPPEEHDTSDNPIQAYSDPDADGMACDPDEAYTEPIEGTTGDGSTSYSTEAYTEPTEQADSAPEMATYPTETHSKKASAPKEKEMDPAAKLLKFLDHIDVILDIKESLTPSFTTIYFKIKKIRNFINSISDIRKGSVLSPGDNYRSIGKRTLKAFGKGIGFSLKAIDLTYWASVKGAKLVARGIWATQELTGHMTEEQYENSVNNMNDNVPESLIGLALLPTETFQNLSKIMRLGGDILEEFTALKVLKRSLQNGDASMSDVVSTITDLKAYLKNFLELCQQVEEAIGDLGFDVDLKPIEKAINKFSYPLRRMKDLLGDDKPKPKSGNDDAPVGGMPALKKSLEPGYKPLLDSLPW